MTPIHGYLRCRSAPAAGLCTSLLSGDDPPQYRPEWRCLARNEVAAERTSLQGERVAGVSKQRSDSRTCISTWLKSCLIDRVTTSISRPGGEGCQQRRGLSRSAHSGPPPTCTVYWYTLISGPDRRGTRYCTSVPLLPYSPLHSDICTM